ncbi:MAG TPA: hypothetical protein DHV14_02575, partial [Micrococcales bacterium]|nr:hypothetical protein [Micrococcales bacterium]
PPAAPAAASAAPAQQGAAFWQPGVSVAEPGYTESTASAAFPGAAGAPGAASGAPAVATATSGAVTPKPRRSWPAVAAAAMLAAVLASGGTALATGAFDQSAAPSAYSDLGTTTQVAASTTTDVDWQSLASQVRDSVVAITVVMSGGTAAGSGVVIDAGNGYVVTNNHVVSGATSGGITVTLADGRIFDATIVGTDPTTDIAVVKLTDPPSDLKAAQWGDSSQVLVGEDVMAVGNPLGLASTVTTGIVSAVDRPVSTTGEESSASSAPVVTNAIQIDAAINPGNS